MLLCRVVCLCVRFFFVWRVVHYFVCSCYRSFVRLFICLAVCNLFWLLLLLSVFVRVRCCSVALFVWVFVFVWVLVFSSVRVSPCWAVYVML